MRYRISLTTKLVALMSVMMLTVSVVIVAILIDQLNVMLDTQHQQSHTRRYQQMVQTDESIVERLVWWVESVTSEQTNQPFDEIWQTLDTGRIGTEFSYRIEAIWLKTPTTMFSDRSQDVSATPEVVTALIDMTQRDPRPYSVMRCEGVCVRYLSVPLFRDDGDVPVVVIRTQVSDLLAQFSRSQGGRVLMLNAIEESELPLAMTLDIPMEWRDFWHHILSELAASDLDILMQNHPLLVELQDTTWSLSMLQLPQLVGTPVVILHADNITALLADYRRYEQRVVIGAFGILFVFTCLIYLSTRRYRRKLTGLAKRLPLLAQHRYDEFRLLSASTEVGTSWVEDEVDWLLGETQRLATELERIDANINFTNAQLERMAMFDTLTGLPNRNMLSFQVKQKLADGHRTGLSLALMFIDLDDFKKVNDTCGHDQGDELIKAAAQRITSALRESDIAARFGGDEFVVLLSGVTSLEQVQTVAQKLMKVFEQAIRIGQQDFYISISIGISMAQPGQSNVDELLRHADIAMYEAKRRSGSSLEVFDDAMTQQVVKRVELETEVRTALSEGQFYLALQPQIDLVYRRLEGFEALIRWRHPERGEISPGEFLPVLEGTRLMSDIDDFVIERALSLMQTLESWGYKGLKMAINLSTARYTDPCLPDVIERRLAYYQLSAQQLALEVTESVLLADTDCATDVMQRLRGLGCSLVIDDFGTGYASFSYLKRLPVDVVKIDRSFVASIHDRMQDRSIVSATVNMARDMSLKIIAEGIETEQQYMHLVKLGCDTGQGYWIARPIAEAHLRNVLRENTRNGVWQINANAA